MTGRAATPQGRKLNKIHAKYKLFCTFCKVKLPIDWTICLLKKSEQMSIWFDFCELKLYIVVFNDIRAVSMTVCWHQLLFQFSNFEFPDLVIYLHAANSNYYL
jgi:hypothetical protein